MNRKRYIEYILERAKQTKDDFIVKEYLEIRDLLNEEELKYRLEHMTDVQIARLFGFLEAAEMFTNQEIWLL